MDSKPEDTEHQGLNSALGLFIGLMIVLVVLVVFVLPEFKYSPINPVPPVNDCITNQYLVVLGKPLQNKEAEDVLVQIKNDLKIDKEIIILEGSYWIASRILAASFPELQPNGYSFSRYYIVVDSDFYKNLSSEEKRGIIAHEMGHIDNIEILVQMQIGADSFATKYVSPQTLIDLLNKSDFNRSARQISKEYKLRIENLEKIKKLKQGQ